MSKPLILVTNDDGIDSAALWALAEALMPLGEVLVVAPDRQWSGAGRSLPFNTTGRVASVTRELAGQQVVAYAVDGSPALCVVHGMVELASRRPACVVSGINFGVNLGNEVTISGTVGAALEGAAFGVPAMAISQEMDASYHLVGDDGADYRAAMAVAQRFVRYLLDRRMPHDVDVLNVNVPSCATPHTPWRLTRASRRRSFRPLPPNRSQGQGRPSFRLIGDHSRAEMDSDIWALRVDRVVSVTPLSLDMTARTDLDDFNHCLSDELSHRAETTQISPFFVSYPSALIE